MRWILTLTLLLSAPAAANPLASATPETMRLDGVITERLPAGHYTYLRITAPGGPIWLATMGPGAAPGERVAVQSFAQANDFQSRRLGRRFSVLHFGTITPR